MSDPEFQKNLETFNSRGFVHIKGLLDKDQVRLYSDALAVALEKQDSQWSQNEYYRDQGMVHNPMIHDDLFMDYLATPAMLDYLEAALDPHCILYAFTTSSMPPSGSNFSNRIHVDSPRVISNYPTNLGFFTALTDFTEENGATYYLPQSHERIEPPTEKEFFANAERPMLKAGDAVMFNARIWHMGGQNNTDHYRHALTINVCRSYMRQRFDYPRMLGEEMLDKLDERLLRFLGYRVRIPVDLDEYYVAPEKRLYYPGQE